MNASPSPLSISTLGIFAASTAASAGVDFLLDQGVKPTNAQVAALTLALRAHTKAALSEALADGHAALKLGGRGGESLAIQTVTATFRLAGIAAAREILAVSFPQVAPDAHLDDMGE